MSPLRVDLADLANPIHAAAIVALVDEYARTPAGGEEPLSEFAKTQLIPGLQHSGAFAILAWQQDRPVGVAVCLTGFSTFAGQPLVNIHDLAVTADLRGQGVGSQLLEAVADVARIRGCCKVTLEVREFNDRAEALYRRLGFTDPSSAPTRFLERKL